MPGGKPSRAVRAPRAYVKPALAEQCHEAGAVVQLEVVDFLVARSRFPVVAGYRFMHISNGGYSPRNPGLNMSSLILGVRYRR